MCSGNDTSLDPQTRAARIGDGYDDAAETFAYAMLQQHAQALAMAAWLRGGF